VLCVEDGINETRDYSAALRIAVCLPCEALAQGAAGMIRQVWMFDERFQLTFHLRRNRHLTASAERLSRPNPISVVVIPNLFDIA
jgi:hypothetical protein